MSLISLQDVAFRYDTGVVVEQLSFAVEAGQYLCVVGENGSGKSTLIKGLLRLKAPCRGTLSYGEGLRAAEIGYLPQQTAAQKDFPASVFEVVLSGRQGARGILPFYSRRDKEMARRNMKRLDILDLQRRCYRELSGGQQQRALLARALCATDKLLLLDEPVAGLDPIATSELYRLIADINREDGVTVIMVSHDIASAVSHASHILHLKGKQVYFGKAEDYRASRVGSSYLGGGEIA